MKTKKSVLAIFCLLLLGGQQKVFAQQNISVAALNGQVKDASAIIEGAEVTLKNAAMSQILNAVSDRDGRFRFNYVPVGNYELKAEKPFSLQSTAILRLPSGRF